MNSGRYLKIYTDFRECLTTLGDAEKGRLFDAMLLYAERGEEPNLSGNERHIWPLAKMNIDRQRETYDAMCRRNKENRSVTARHRSSQTATNGDELREDKDKDKDKDKDTNITPLPPLAPFPGASPELCDAFAAWLSYKKERRETYKATGLQALMLRIQTAAGQYGDHAVAELIRDCMAASWKGIIFDRLKNAPPPSRQQRASWADIAAQMDAEEVYQ